MFEYGVGAEGVAEQDIDGFRDEVQGLSQPVGRRAVLPPVVRVARAPGQVERVRPAARERLDEGAPTVPAAFARPWTSATTGPATPGARDTANRSRGPRTSATGVQNSGQVPSFGFAISGGSRGNSVTGRVETYGGVAVLVIAAGDQRAAGLFAG